MSTPNCPKREYHPRLLYGQIFMHYKKPVLGIRNPILGRADPIPNVGWEIGTKRAPSPAGMGQPVRVFCVFSAYLFFFPIFPFLLCLFFLQFCKNNLNHFLIYDFFEVENFSNSHFFKKIVNILISWIS